MGEASSCYSPGLGAGRLYSRGAEKRTEFSSAAQPLVEHNPLNYVKYTEFLSFLLFVKSAVIA